MKNITYIPPRNNKAKNIKIEDVDNNFQSNNVEGALKELAENGGSGHIHDNKTVLDTITQEKVDSWDDVNDKADKTEVLLSSKLNDNGTGVDELWSASKVNAQFNTIEQDIGTETLPTTSQTLKGAIAETFQNVSNGKQLIATAITDKGVSTSSDATFQTMATNIGLITGGSVNGRIITLNNIKYVLTEDVDGNITATIAKYAITNTLSNATNSNSNNQVEFGSSYTSTITANIGYLLNTVVVIMGGVDITSTVYSNGNINIASVTDNILITVTTVVDPSNNIIGTMATDNTITINNLSAGIYTLKYEDENGILNDYEILTSSNETTSLEVI